jgi:hypothetical protein
MHIQELCVQGQIIGKKEQTTTDFAVNMGGGAFLRGKCRFFDRKRVVKKGIIQLNMSFMQGKSFAELNEN